MPKVIDNLGGSAPYHVVKAGIAITGMGPGARDRTWEYSIDLHIAVPDEYNAELPSVIGRDSIGNWALSIPRTADTFHIVPPK